MKKFATFALIIGFVLSAPALSTPAFAKHGKGHGKGHEHAKPEKEHLIHGSNRDAIKAYLKSHYGKSCPPGLAKKNNGCLPPGIAKKYTLGQPLPADILGAPLPDDLLKMLYPPHYGQEYVQVDKDILLIDQASRKVIDAVTLLSALGN